MICNNNIMLSWRYSKVRLKWPYVTFIRTKTSEEPKKKTYFHTINIPKTKFPGRPKKGHKEEIEQAAQFSELYNWQAQNLNGREFILHDGPPYANGDLHLGHAVNKIIKDICNRSQVLQGNKVHYVPGWDCHGLPIELKALNSKPTKNESSDPVLTRQIARSFALKTVNSQKDTFKNWGIMADWNNQCYLTLNKNYVQNQLWQFYKMYKKGIIYRALKPVYWSPSTKTALAEAELEYDNNFESTEVYVRFAVKDLFDGVKDIVKNKPVSALVWTTTPWTLIANKAIAYNPKMVYCLVTIDSRPDELFLIAKDQVEEIKRVLGVDVGVLNTFNGQNLNCSTYTSALTGETLPFVGADHVTSGKGTGLVHTAPAHGPDDFLVALMNNITVECNVDEHGKYINLGPEFDGLDVLKEGQDAVIKRLGDSIVQRGSYVHSYPRDWRTKQPVILRASLQWFIDTGALKERAMAALDEVTILPRSNAEQSRHSFRAQLEKRPYWCISRQRAWGVPIPAVYRGDDAIVDKDIIQRLCSLMESRGPDVWWTCGIGELVGDQVAAKYALKHEDLTKGEDIMDIWLDSGLSWHTLGNRKSTIYVEGLDQINAWFQVSLLTSIALRDDAPYQSVYVHGFVVDEEKRKMSKSIGNFIEPKTIIDGAGKQPAYGINTFRWWVASHGTQHSQIVISKKLLEECQSEIIRLRNHIKFMLGALADLERGQFEKQLDLNYFDQYTVHECQKFLELSYEYYNDLRFNALVQSTLHFASNKMSSLYFHCIKDRLYCSRLNSAERISAQLVMHTILITMFRVLGPILPHLIEEAWQYHPLYKKPFFFTKDIPILKSNNVDTSLMEEIMDIKTQCNKKKERSEDLKAYKLYLYVNECLYEKIMDLNMSDGVNDSVLCEILEVASVDVKNMGDTAKSEVELEKSPRGQCLRCLKYNAVDTSDKCLRCERSLA